MKRTKRTVTIGEIKKMEGGGIATFSKKDNSPRGYKTVSINEIEVGDEVIINNYFHLVIE